MTTVLLIEDNPADVRLVQEVLKATTFDINLQTLDDGEVAVEMLKSGEISADVILLDLNLPKMDGREILQALKTDESLKRIPIIVLTCSQLDQDVLQSYDLHANCYIVKPIDLKGFIQAVKNIETFWLGTVTLPAKSNTESTNDPSPTN